MRIVRWNPRYNRMNLINEFDRMFENALEWPRMERVTNLGLAVDVAEREDSFVVKASLPGVNVDDIEITLEDDALTIRGEVKEDAEFDGESYHVRERSYGSFSRCIRFPVPVDAENVDATYENGVLSLSVPKADEVKPKRIAVKAG